MRASSLLRPLAVIAASLVNLLLIVGMMPATSSTALAQAAKPATPAPAAASPRAALDPRIGAALQQVSAKQVQATIEKLVGFGTRLTLSAQDADSIKAGRGIGAAREWIKSEFERYSKDCGGCLEVKTDSFLQPAADRIPSPVQLTNVYAVLKGSDAANASRVVLVTGHYDSRNSDTFDAKGDAPGANDDASGTAVSLECARVLSQMSVKHKFPATIIFLAVAGEEQGLNGSDHFAKFMREQEKAGAWTLEAVLNNDIVGGDKSPGQQPEVVRVFSEGLPIAADDKQVARIRGLGGESDSPSRELARYVAEVGRAYRVGTQPEMVFRLDRYLRGGDHYSFNKQGFAAVRFTEYRENYDRQHQNVRTEKGVVYGDTPDHVDFGYVARVAKLNAATLASLALGPAPPANVRLLTKDLENVSTLVWDAAPGGLATNYEVLWRATSAADWEHSQLTGNVTKFTLPLSKDNVILAVRAVGKDGARSLPVVPVPER